ncbi:MAG: TRAP transporter large permease subunit [Spirochaetaceae bacterium]|jgi:tripartite ATP-independent transporter DctM subunit|nr:TRAP transporter large permease subunit [Spirochaetaceae bacterium]
MIQPLRRIDKTLNWLEKFICYGSLAFLVLLPIGECFTRYIFKAGIPEAQKLMNHALLVLGLFSGMMTTKRGEHLSVALTQYIQKESTKIVLSAITGFIAVLVSVIIAIASLTYVMVGLAGNIPILFIPIWLIGLVMPLGYTVMAVRFGARSRANFISIFQGKKVLSTVLPIIAVIIGICLAFPSIVKLVWGFNSPDAAYYLSEDIYAALYNARWFIAILLVVAAFAGGPLFISIGGLAMLFLMTDHGELEIVPHQIYVALTNKDYIAIPLFTLTGFLLSESKAGMRLVRFFKALCGWLHGGMIISTVVICAFFSAFTGDSGVTILALGGLLYTILHEQAGYPDRFCTGLLTSVGSIGMFPPSLPLILIGTSTMTSVVQMFAGAFLPSIIMVVAVIVFGIITSIRTKIPVEKFSFKQLAAGFKTSWLEILLPFILIIGFFTGTFSLVEIGAIAALYCFIAEVLVNKEIKLREIPHVFGKAIPIIGGILSILAVASALSYFIVDSRAPEVFAAWMKETISSKILFLLILNLSLLVVGCLMDVFSAIMIVLPLILPVGLAYGISPVHLGIIFNINLELGFLTPPIGMNLFLASYRFKKPYLQITRNVLPFLIIQFVVVMLVTYCPPLTTWLASFF